MSVRRLLVLLPLVGSVLAVPPAGHRRSPHHRRVRPRHQRRPPGRGPAADEGLGHPDKPARAHSGVKASVRRTQPGRAVSFDRAPMTMAPSARSVVGR